MTVAGGPDGGWDSHLLLLYRDDVHRQRSVALWVKRGLDLGEKILYTRAPDDAALLPRLTLQGVDVGAAARRGQLTMLPLADLFSPGASADFVREALDEGYPGVRLSTRANAVLDHLTEEEYLALDRVLDDLCGRLPVSAMCQYEVGRTDGRSMETVIESHPHAVRDAQMRIRRTAGAVLLAGEVDVTSAGALMLLLRSACRTEDFTELEMELSELVFLDVTGCRALVAGTSSLRSGGGTLVLRGANRHIRKVLTLLEMDRLPGVELA